MDSKNKCFGFDGVKKYSLMNEAIAAASSGMYPVTGLDTRSLKLTIQLNHRSHHEPLCRELYEATENFCRNLSIRKKSISYSGLGSFLDVNGSKFTGADRDFRQIHCHGFIFIPHNISPEDQDSLISLLEAVALGSTQNDQLCVKQSVKAVQIERFVQHQDDKSLLSYVSYAQKEAVRNETVTDFGVFFPFEDRTKIDRKTKAQIEKMQWKTLQTLRGPDAHMIFQAPKKEVFGVIPTYGLPTTPPSSTTPLQKQGFRAAQIIAQTLHSGA